MAAAPFVATMEVLDKITGKNRKAVIDFNDVVGDFGTYRASKTNGFEVENESYITDISVPSATDAVTVSLGLFFTGGDQEYSVLLADVLSAVQKKHIEIPILVPKGKKIQWKQA
jgi:hypothetical protein